MNLRHPEKHGLPLLPSGPDGVHPFPSHRAQSLPNCGQHVRYHGGRKWQAVDQSESGQVTCSRHRACCGTVSARRACLACEGCGHKREAEPSLVQGFRLAAGSPAPTTLRRAFARDPLWVSYARPFSQPRSRRVVQANPPPFLDPDSTGNNFNNAAATSMSLLPGTTSRPTVATDAIERKIATSPDQLLDGCPCEES